MLIGHVNDKYREKGTWSVEKILLILLSSAFYSALFRNKLIFPKHCNSFKGIIIHPLCQILTRD